MAWVGLGWISQSFGGLGWVKSKKLHPRTTLVHTRFPVSTACEVRLQPGEGSVRNSKETEKKGVVINGVES